MSAHFDVSRIIENGIKLKMKKRISIACISTKHCNPAKKFKLQLRVTGVGSSSALNIFHSFC
jgi:hypothetical protein